MKHQANKISLNIPFISNLSDYNEKKLLRAINLLIHGAVAFCLLFLINMGVIDTYSLAIVYTSIIFPVALARFLVKK